MKRKRFVFVSDSHGNLLDDDAGARCREFVEDYRPDYRFHLGDVYNLDALRSGATREEKAEGITADIEAGNEFLSWYRPHGLIWGNHDNRMFEAASKTNNGIVGDHCRSLIDLIYTKYLHSTKVYEFDVDSVVDFYDFKLVHGFAHGVHGPYKMAQHFGNVVFGDIHTSTGPVPFARHGGAEAWSCGCLCEIKQGYNKKNLNRKRHNHGWIYGEVTPTGRLMLRHAMKKDGEWLI